MYMVSNTFVYVLKFRFVERKMIVKNYDKNKTGKKIDLKPVKNDMKWKQNKTKQKETKQNRQIGISM